MNLKKYLFNLKSDFKEKFIRQDVQDRRTINHSTSFEFEQNIST